MPEYTPLAQIPIPLRPEVDDMSAILKAIGLAIDPLLVLRAKNVADLARYDGVPVGTIVVGTEQEAIWRKRLAGGWATVWSDSGIVEAGVSVANGDDFHVVHEWGRIRGGRVDIDIAARWDSDPLSNPTGAITARKMCQVAAEFRPDTAFVGAYTGNHTGGASFIDTAGWIWIRDMNSGATIDTGDQLRVGFNIPQRGN